MPGFRTVIKRIQKQADLVRKDAGRSKFSAGELAAYQYAIDQMDDYMETRRIAGLYRVKMSETLVIHGAQLCVTGVLETDDSITDPGITCEGDLSEFLDQKLPGDVMMECIYEAAVIQCRKRTGE